MQQRQFDAKIRTTSTSTLKHRPSERIVSSEIFHAYVRLSTTLLKEKGRKKNLNQIVTEENTFSRKKNKKNIKVKMSGEGVEDEFINMGLSMNGGPIEIQYRVPLIAKLLHSLPHYNITFHRTNNTFRPTDEVYLEVSTCCCVVQITFSKRRHECRNSLTILTTN